MLLNMFVIKNEPDEQDFSKKKKWNENKLKPKQTNSFSGKIMIAIIFYWISTKEKDKTKTI